MNIYGISDLHLSGNPPYKNMIVFGEQYKDYMAKIEAGFKSLPADSVVINTGDISWATSREEALTDLRWLDSFGVKIVNTIGNHDYWWGKKGAEFMNNWAFDNGLKNLYFVDHQQLFTIGYKGFTVAAVKGCDKFADYNTGLDNTNLPPSHKNKDAQTTPKHWEKYLRRLEAALLLNPDILVSHIPPFNTDGSSNEMTDLIVKSKSVQFVLYGHRHSAPETKYDNKVIDGVVWLNLLCERMDFVPKFIVEQNITTEA